MNADLIERLHNHLPPFDGVTYHTPARFEIVWVRKGLQLICNELQTACAEITLFNNYDHYETDRLALSGRLCSWNEVLGWLETDNRLFQAASGEEGLATIVYPEDYSFVLRFWIEPVPTPGENLHGRFDVTCVEELARHVQLALTGTFVEFSATPPASFFDWEPLRFDEEERDDE